MKRIRGRFILSINDVPAVRELFAWFDFAEVETTYSLPGAGGVRAAELIIQNRG